MIFEDVEQLLAVIASDQRSPNLPVEKSTYYLNYRPSKVNFKRIILDCKYCKSKLHLRLTSDKKLLVTEANHIHSHARNKFESSAEEEIYEMYRHQKFTDKTKSVDLIAK